MVGLTGLRTVFGSRLFPTISASCFRCVFRWMPFSVSTASCMSGKSGGDLILRHVPSSEGFDKMERPCDTCSSLVRIIIRIPTMNHVWLVMALMGLGFWAAVHFSLLSLPSVLGSMSFLYGVVGLCLWTWSN